ncbi:MAG: Rrf2 family transcriptional regulator [Planctomycetota bacterium]
MLVSQKCQYALRAVFELARRAGHGPVKIADIANAQAIPPRFLEVILSQLKQSGFIDSQRGSDGGYILSRQPDHLTVGEILRFMQGPLGPIECVTGDVRTKCPLHRGCVFLPMWEKVRDAMAGVYDNTTFQDLLAQESQMQEKYVPCYSI